MCLIKYSLWRLLICYMFQHRGAFLRERFSSVRKDFLRMASWCWNTWEINPLTPNDLYTSHAAPLTPKRCILYIYSTNIGTEYFKHALYSPFFSSSKCSLFHNANFFGSCIIHILYTGVLKLKKYNSGAKGLILVISCILWSACVGGCVNYKYAQYQ